MIAPPANVSPGRLFRLMLTLPRPVEALDYRLEAAPQAPLFAQALAPLELAEALEDDSRDAAIVAAALVDRRGARLVRTRDLLLLTEREFADLRGAVFAALHRISPSYRLADADAWDRVLRTGAAQHMSTVVAMGACREAVGTRIVEAPDKFFGVPRCALMDGHWMAFRAAQRLYEDRQPKG